MTSDQVNRWRRGGLLPKEVEQLRPDAYHGSEVRYPVGTCAQIKAARALFRKKNRSEYVGWELWWRGFSVDEDRWRPRLIQAAGWGDKALRIFKVLSRRDDERESFDTIADRTVQAGSSNSFYLKIKRRVSQANLPALLGMLLDTAAGDFEGAIPKDLESPLKRAFDMEAKANLPPILRALRALRVGDKPMVLMAIATIRAETARFEPISEGKSRFNTSPNGHPFDLYDSRKDLGNRGAPDGANFKGRGFVQLTGRFNYEKYDNELGLGGRLIADPELANDQTIAAELLARFLKDKENGIRAALDKHDLIARKLVNGGSHGVAEFIDAFNTGNRIIN